MKKRCIVRSASLLVGAFSFIIPAMCFSDGTGDANMDVEIAATPLQEWMPNVAYNSVDNEFMVLWHATVARKEDAQKMYSLHGQRVSPEGKLLGKAFSLVPAGPERKTLPMLDHNMATNQYMVSFNMEQKETDQDPFVMILDRQGNILSGPTSLSSKPTTESHAIVAFNSKRRQYLVAYNDGVNVGANIFGVILDENGAVIKQNFTISSAKGDQINPHVFYNPTDDTYLVNWEDFRHVKHWREPSNIYGALLNGNGDIIADDIPMMEDHGLADEGDQRHNTIVHNPQRNEFLVCWTDTRPSLDNVGVTGRIIKSDGSLAGPAFTIADAPGPQIFPHVQYSQKREMYLAIWDDGRNDDPGRFWREVDNWDVYAVWLTPSGQRKGSDFPICAKKGTQRFSTAVYAPAADRFLITWRDSNAPGDYEPIAGAAGGHLRETKGDIRGTIYRAP
jgi:hypothetical protein